MDQHGIRLRCPYCGASIRMPAPDLHRRATFTCPRCGRMLPQGMDGQ